MLWLMLSWALANVADPTENQQVCTVFSPFQLIVSIHQTLSPA